jgi:hypothetical protein
MSSSVRRALVALGFVTSIVVAPALPARADPTSARAHALDGNPAEPASCDEDCWVLHDMTVRGAVTSAMSFELHGGVRGKGEQKIPLVGPPSQVRLDDVTIDGARATVTFDNDRYYVITQARAFTLRGKLTLGSDQMLSVAGPLLAFDAHLTKGRVVEGEKLSGLSSTVLHFDPMVEGAEANAPAKPKPPPVFRLSRALRYGSETTFVYRLVASQTTDLGTIRLPLKIDEKVQDVQGVAGWSVEGKELVLPTSGKEAEITISGVLPPQGPTAAPKSYGPDERSSYEWWMIEADPEHRVSVEGEGKLVETSQSPIPSTMPGARVYLLQRGQHIEVDAKSLVRGDVLAAVARTHKRYVAITGRGELISDETIAFDNNGLDHLMLSPAGKAMYLSTDASSQSILHTEAGAHDVIVPLRPGSHQLRVQSLGDVRLWPIAGAVAIPSSSYPLATSTMEVTVGLPDHVRPLAVLGGDRARWAFSRGDLVAVILGVAVACFAFRTKKTRALGSLATGGLWFVSREGFVVGVGILFVAGAIFLASRFLRGNWLVVASGASVIVALLGGRFALVEGAAEAPQLEMFAKSPSLPQPEVSTAALHSDGTLDTKAGIRPVSMSFPTSERYVQSSRQLVTRERPFVPRIVYVTSTLVAFLHVLWLAVVGALAWSHRDRLAALKAKIMDRLARRGPAVAPAAPTAAAAPLAVIPATEPPF